MSDLGNACLLGSWHLPCPKLEAESWEVAWPQKLRARWSDGKKLPQTRSLGLESRCERELEFHHAEQLKLLSVIGEGSLSGTWHTCLSAHKNSSTVLWSRDPIWQTRVLNLRELKWPSQGHLASKETQRTLSPKTKLSDSQSVTLVGIVSEPGLTGCCRLEEVGDGVVPGHVLMGWDRSSPGPKPKGQRPDRRGQFSSETSRFSRTLETGVCSPGWSRLAPDPRCLLGRGREMGGSSEPEDPQAPVSLCLLLCKCFSSRGLWGTSFFVASMSTLTG